MAREFDVTGGRRNEGVPWSALASLAWALASTAAGAADVHGTLLVSVHVSPVARLQVESGILPLQVSAADVASGYVDAPGPLELRIDSNSRAGFAVDVSTLSPWCVAVVLRGFDATAELDGAEGTVTQRWRGGASRRLSLQARFKLAANVQPGSYPWPLRLSVRPL